MPLCSKISYVTRKHAAASLNRMRRKNHVGVAFGKPYRCPVCGGWHLGNKITKKAGITVLWKKSNRAMKLLFELIDECCGVH